MSALDTDTAPKGRLVDDAEEWRGARRFVAIVIAILIVALFAACTGDALELEAAPAIVERDMTPGNDLAPATFQAEQPATCPDCDGFPAYQPDGGAL